MLLDGAWGFATNPIKPQPKLNECRFNGRDCQSCRLSQQTGVQLALVEVYRNTYTTPIEIDPFSVPITDKADLLPTKLTCSVLGDGRRSLGSIFRKKPRSIPIG